MGRITPRPVRRELRQETNFGCAICGAPLLEYHHIIPYEEEEHHDPDQMVALCPNHHQFADDGAISRAELYDAKEDPKLNDVVDYDFYFDPESPIIPLGSHKVELASFGQYTLISIFDEPIIRVNYTDSRIEFDINFHNEDNDLIAVVTQNEWWADTTEFWDIRYQSNRLKLWNEKYEIGLLTEFNPKEHTISFRGRFLYDGEELVIHPSSIKYPRLSSGIHGRMGFILGGDEVYESRMDIDSGINAIHANGLFSIGGSGDGFVFKFSLD